MKLINLHFLLLFFFLYAVLVNFQFIKEISKSAY